MKRLWIFSLVLGGALIFFAIVIAWYTLYFQSGNATMYGMMGQMMGGQYPVTANPMPSYVWFSVIALIAGLAAGVIGTVYYAMYPEIRHAKGTDSGQVPIASSKVDPQAEVPSDPSLPKESWTTLLRTSKPEEKLVLDVLSAHDGVYLQKLIVKETGLSKLKTHRIISRLAERGIVTASKSGNTNEVRLSSWLNQPEKSS